MANKITQDIEAAEANLSAEAKVELAKIRAMAKDVDESATLAYWKTHKPFVIGLIVGLLALGSVIGHYLSK